MKWTPPGFGGQRPNAEEIKRDSWHEFNILVICADDQRLDWTERELVLQLGERLYGSSKRKKS